METAVTSSAADNAEGKAQIAPVFDNSLCTINLDLAAYDGDRSYIEDFTKDPDIQTAMSELKQKNPEAQSRRLLLKSALRITPVLSPALYAIGKKCSDRIGLRKTIEFYIDQTEGFNACCYPPDSERCYIAISAGILEKFDEAELSFVIGHEIGHVLFGHSRFAPRSIMNQGEDYLSPLHAMKLYAWSRCAEISADRIGLLCCGDYNAAARCFFKLSSGVTTSSIEFRLPEYISQFSDLHDIIKGSAADPDDWYSTHPFSPLRIKALELFEHSRTYSTLAGAAGGETAEDELESQIMRILNLMEPSYLENTDENSRKIQEFIFLAGYFVTISDGEILQEEIQALGKIVSPEVFEASMKSVNGAEPEPVLERLKKLAEDINALSSIMQKLGILKDLCVISNADGKIGEKEIAALYSLADILSIKESFIDKTLGEMNAGK